MVGRNKRNGLKNGFCVLPLASDAVFAYSEKGFQRIQVLVQGNEGFESSTGIDSCGSDHGGQYLHVHYGTIKQRTKEWHLLTQRQSRKRALRQTNYHCFFHFIVNNEPK